MDNNDQVKTSKRNKILLGLITFFILLGAVAFIYWVGVLRYQVTTSDAYVAGNIILVMSNQTGTAIQVFADDTDYVQQGQLLIQLDPTNYEIAFERAKTELALAARQVRQLLEQVQQGKAQVAVHEADFSRARQDFERRQSIQSTAAISVEDLNHAHLSMQAADASLNLARHQLNASLASLGSTPPEKHPTIQQAEIALREAYINLQHCRILAPNSGFVAQRNVQVGEWVTPNRPLMSIIPLNQIWIDANFKETQLRDIRIGQPALVEADIYGSSVNYHGHVEGIEAGTGSAFSLIPPQNATGNWIKIVQRLPVRIRLNPEELRQHPLRIGLSTYVKVDISDRSGHILSTIPLTKPKFTTPVYDIPIEPVEKLIQEIIQDNLYSQTDQRT